MRSKLFYRSVNCFCTVMTDKPCSLLKERWKSPIYIWPMFQLAYIKIQQSGMTILYVNWKRVLIYSFHKLTECIWVNGNIKIDGQINLYRILICKLRGSSTRTIDCMPKTISNFCFTTAPGRLWWWECRDNLLNSMKQTGTWSLGLLTSQPIFRGSRQAHGLQ